VITSMDEGLQAIVGSARQLVCRTRGSEATVLNRKLRPGVSLAASARGFLASRGTGGVVIYGIDEAFFLRAAAKVEGLLARIRRPARTLFVLRQLLRDGAIAHIGQTT
jgi:hypothetical protein